LDSLLCADLLFRLRSSSSDDGGSRSTAHAGQYVLQPHGKALETTAESTEELPVKAVAESSKGKEKAQPKNLIVLSDSADPGPGYGNHVSSPFAISLLAPEGKSKS
jgi:hypothetical protein